MSTVTECVRLEHLVLERTRALEQSREMYRLMAESTRAIPFILDITHGCFSHIGPQAAAAFGFPEFQWKESGALDVIIPRQSNPEVRMRFDECESGSFECMTPLVHIDGRRTEVRWTGTCELVEGAKILRGLMLDVTEVRRRGLEVAASQKLESVGRLAAGVAHEINTPVQFVTDNVHFVRTSMTDIAAVVLAYRALQHAVQSQGDVMGAAQRASECEKNADLDYILENAPLAIESAIEGLGRIATIVRSMKEFAHPDQAVKQPADLNQAIRSTLVVARNEYRYVAEVDAQLGELPLVPCHLGEINQVILNLLVNASHSIADVVKDSGDLGKLTVRSAVDCEHVEISISDTGMGIPEAVRAKIFDPFFTTKEVGKGNTLLSEDQRQLLAKIQFGGRALLGVVNNVLDLSKIEAGEMSLENEPFDLPDLIRDLGQMLAPQASAKGIELLVQSAPSLPRVVNGDSTVARVALAWVQLQPGVTSTIIGARRMTQLEDNVKALEVTLTAEELAHLDKITKPTFGFPATMQPMFPAIHNGGTTVNGIHAEPSSFGILRGEKPY